MKPLSYIEINSTNLRHNINQFSALLTDTDHKFIIPIKANAYGHGIKEVVTCLKHHVFGFQVDSYEELKEVRKYSKKPVFVFGYILDAQLQECIDSGAILGLYDSKQVKIINAHGHQQNKVIKIHIKIDAFLGRQGILIEDVPLFLEEIKECKNIEVEGVYTHFSDIEDSPSQQHAVRQFETLMQAKELFRSSGYINIKHHISSTSGFLCSSSESWGGYLTRLGIGVYGLWPSESLRDKYSQKLSLKPVLSWKTHVAQVKTLPPHFPVGYGQTYTTQQETKIAVIPQGYSDGYPRSLSNNSEVLIQGSRCRVLGRIAMNMFVVDVNHLTNIQKEEEVYLLGTQQEEFLSAEELALNSRTINYEIVARLSRSLERIITL